MATTVKKKAVGGGEEIKGMEETKGLLRSKTFWFAVLGVIAFFLEKFGVDLSEETRGAISGEIVEVISLVGVVYGRTKAGGVKGVW